jgi:hypothetical protein
LVHHGRANDGSGIADPERQRAVRTWDRAHFKRGCAPEIERDPNVPSCVIWINALANDSARITDSKRRQEIASSRGRLFNNRSRCPFIYRAPLKAPAID